MKKLSVFAVIAISSLSSTIGSVAAESVQTLSGSQIRTKIAGMELTDEVHWRDAYDRDGTLRSYADGKKRVGKWEIEKNELCVYFNDPEDGCYEVSLSGNRIEMKPTGLGLSIDGILQTPTDRN
ncbi:hypothetical protein N2603_42755 [Bradyrhizobium huanghuaihaiense]|uniref:hypothetical protein n=1 Tax=Bradyrhizobium huanghuaihaiense TaxID=990078 RepID=UPI0021AAA132|nr:hypothetical protein [Bradyrhizobium sp. CB3035]UWU76517.1 hypothetical protein N2603_42755 [Bradyrhizobium sp. CB3035]